MVTLIIYLNLWLQASSVVVPKPVWDDLLKSLNPQTSFSWGQFEVTLQTRSQKSRWVYNSGIGILDFSQFLQPDTTIVIRIHTRGLLQKLLFWPDTHPDCLKYYDLTSFMHRTLKSDHPLWLQIHRHKPLSGFWLIRYSKDDQTYVALWQTYWQNHPRSCLPGSKNPKN